MCVGWTLEFNPTDSFVVNHQSIKKQTKKAEARNRLIYYSNYTIKYQRMVKRMLGAYENMKLCFSLNNFL